MIKRDGFTREYLPEFIYGGIDGAVTTFAVAAGAVGASLSFAIILILGFANLFADGFSMAVSNYLSSRSQQQLHPRHKEHFDKKPIKSAIVTFLAFLLVGFIPLLFFVLALLFPAMHQYAFIYSIILTGFAFVFVGSIKGIVTEKGAFQSALETFLIGTIAAAIAYIIGYLLKGLL